MPTFKGIFVFSPQKRVKIAKKRLYASLEARSRLISTS